MDSIPLDPWLGHLETHLPLAREGRDPEGVHQVRVALARLDLWLRAAGWSVLRDDARWLRAGAARVRDLDVQLASDPPAPWAAILERERVRARAELLEMLDDARVDGLLDALRPLAPLPARRLQRHLEALRRQVARRGRELEQEPGELERYHALRKAVRRLRYALEWAGRSAKPVKPLQENLGALNDAAITLDLLSELDGARELEGFRALHEARVEEMRAATLDAWRRSSLAEPDEGDERASGP